MKVLILAGGLGTRLSEDTVDKPKPMVEIGGKPILWHIMKTYSQHGFNDFVILLGYKGYIIKEYFANYFLHQSDVTFDLKDNKMEIHNNSSEPWKVTLLDTGNSSMTGGRIKRAEEFIGKSPFMLTYGDGVSNVDLTRLLEFHKSHGRIATVTAVRPPIRFGELIINDNKVEEFAEKPQSGKGWINGGFFVFNKEIFNYIEDDSIMLEREPLEKLSKMGELMAYKHDDFWQCMDTIREKEILEALLNSNSAPWLK